MESEVFGLTLTIQAASFFWHCLPSSPGTHELLPSSQKTLRNGARRWPFRHLGGQARGRQCVELASLCSSVPTPGANSQRESKWIPGPITSCPTFARTRGVPIAVSSIFGQHAKRGSAIRPLPLRRLPGCSSTTELLRTIRPQSSNCSVSYISIRRDICTVATGNVPFKSELLAVTGGKPLEGCHEENVDRVNWDHLLCRTRRC